MKKSYLIVLSITIWAISLVFRIPFLQDVPPVNNVAHIFLLQTLDIWEHEGPTKSNFAMKHTFDNPGDKGITYYKRYEDAAGNNYYVSHPSFAQSFVWVISGAGLVHVDNSFLMWMAMILHLVGIIFLVLIIRMITGHEKPFIIEISAIVVYAFHPVILYMNTFHFFAETLGQLVFLITLWFFVRISCELKPSGMLQLVFAFLLGVLFLSAEWLGMFFMFALFTMIVFKRKQLQPFIKPVLAFSLGVISAFLLYIIQHICLKDAETFVRALGLRFLERSGFFGNQYTDMGYSYANPESYILILRQLWELMKGAGFLFFIPIVLLFTRGKRTTVAKGDQAFRWILPVLLISCGYYFIVLFSATITHYIYTAKWVVPLTIWLAISLTFIKERLKSRAVQISGLIMIAILTGWSVFVFHQKASLLQSPDNGMIHLAETIALQTEKDESVFYRAPENKPLTGIIWLSYMSQRNIAPAENESDICNYRANLPENYIYYYFENDSLYWKRGFCPKKGE